MIEPGTVLSMDDCIAGCIASIAAFSRRSSCENGCCCLTPEFACPSSAQTFEVHWLRSYRCRRSGNLTSLAGWNHLCRRRGRDAWKRSIRNATVRSWKTMMMIAGLTWSAPNAEAMEQLLSRPQMRSHRLPKASKLGRIAGLTTRLPVRNVEAQLDLSEPLSL